MKFFKYTFLFLIILLVVTCTKPPEYPIEPVIEFERVSKSVIPQSNINADTSIVTFSFTDGDGDLGTNDSVSLFVTDTRTGFLEQYKIPFIPELGRSNGIRGEISFNFLSTCCIYPDPLLLPCSPQTIFPTDTLVLSIFLRDRAGNQSNTIESEPIILLCN